jgi:hypothetical protein
MWRGGDGFNSAKRSDQAFVVMYSLDLGVQSQNWSCVSEGCLQWVR